MSTSDQHRYSEHVLYVDSIINIMKEDNPTLNDDDIINNEHDYYNSEERRIFPCMVVDIIVQNNNYEEKIDTIRCHIPYFLRMCSLKKYMQSAIIDTYLIDRDLGFNIINIKKCMISSNTLDLNQRLNVNISQISENNQEQYFRTFGDIITSLFERDTISMTMSSTNDIYDFIERIKICVFVDSFIELIINTFAEINNIEVHRNSIIHVEPINVRSGECPICYDNINIGEYYQCSHGICPTCYDLWKEQNKITCPVCRSHTRNDGPRTYRL